MKRFVSILIMSFVLVLAFATFGGLAVFGMDRAMEVGHATGDLNCLSHCLDVVSLESATVAQGTVSAFVVLLVLLFVAWQSSEIVAIPSIVRWREGIGKRYRQRELAVVRIQD